MHLKICSAEWWPSYPGEDELTMYCSNKYSLRTLAAPAGSHNISVWDKYMRSSKAEDKQRKKWMQFGIIMPDH